MLDGAPKSFDPEAVAYVDKSICSIALIDDNAEAFRYPQTRGGKPYLRGDFTHITYGVIKDYAETLYAIFEDWLLVHDALPDRQKA